MLDIGEQTPDVWAYWGTNDGGTVKGNWQTNAWLGPAGTGSLTNHVTGLRVNQRYWYRFYGTNSGGEDWASQATVFTSTAPPGAQTLYWDPDLDSADGADGGAGTWNTSTAQWWNATYALYAAGVGIDTYVFDGSGGPVTVPNTANWKTVGALRFATNGYTLTDSGGGYMTVGTITVDPGVTVTLDHRPFPSPTFDGGGTLLYTCSAAAGSIAGGCTIASGTTVIASSGGLNGYYIVTGPTYAPLTINGTFQAGMDNAIRSGHAWAVQVNAGGTWNMNNRSQGGAIDGSAALGSSGGIVLLSAANARLLGGGPNGDLAIYGRAYTGNQPFYGSLIVTNGSIDMQGGDLGVFTTTNDDFDVHLNGGTLSTGDGKLILGQGEGSDLGRAVNVTLLGSGSLSGHIDLSNARNNGAKMRTLDVGAGGFTIAAAIADGARAGSGIIKTGSGTLVLGGTNTFTGPLTNQAGTVTLAGTLPSSRITVTGPTATLDGSGTLTVTTGDVIRVANGATLDLSAGLCFRLQSRVAPVIVADFTGGQIVGLSAARVVNPGWFLGLEGSKVIAGKLGTVLMLR